MNIKPWRLENRYYFALVLYSARPENYLTLL